MQNVNGIRKIEAQMMTKMDNSIKKEVLEALKVKLCILAKFSQKRSIIRNAEGLNSTNLNRPSSVH